MAMIWHSTASNFTQEEGNHLRQRSTEDKDQPPEKIRLTHRGHFFSFQNPKAEKKRKILVLEGPNLQKHRHNGKIESGIVANCTFNIFNS